MKKAEKKTEEMVRLVVNTVFVLFKVFVVPKFLKICGFFIIIKTIIYLILCIF